MTSQAPGFGALADRHATLIGLQKVSFPDRPTLEAALEAVRRGMADSPSHAPPNLALLAGSTPPIDAGILRGTTASEHERPPHHGLIYVRCHGDEPDGVWMPPGATAQTGRVRYQRHGGYENPERDSNEAKLAVVVDIDFESPDTSRLATWADLVLDALRTDPARPDALISAQFYVSDDATHVVNLALWSSERDYDTALDSGPPGVAQTDTPQWRGVMSFDGICRNTVSRYTDIATWASERDPAGQLAASVSSRRTRLAG